MNTSKLSTTNRPLISIIIDSVHNFNIAELFVRYRGFDVELISFASAESLRFSSSYASIKLFEPLSDMPGYMRGLSEYLQNSSLVVLPDPYELSAYQSMAAAKKYGIPIWVMLSRPPSSRQILDHQTATMVQEVIRSSCKAYVCNQHSRDYLLLEGVAADDIFPLPNLPMKLSLASAPRSNFRDHVGIKAEEFVVTCPCEHDIDLGRNLLFAIAQIEKKRLWPSPAVRFLIAGEKACEALKYLALDLQVTSKVLFINQDISSIFSNVLAASDLLLCSSGPENQSFASLALQALGWNTRVIEVAPGRQAVDRSPWVVDCTGEVPTLVRNLIKCLRPLPPLTQKTLDQLISDEPSQASFRAAVEQLDEVSRALTPQFSITDEVAAFHAHLSCGERASALKILVKLLGDPRMDMDQKAKVLEEKGLLCFSLGQLEEATESFDAAIQFDSKLWRSYLGLAKISVLTHSEEDAARFFRRVLALKPNNADALGGIGTVYRALGMPEESLYWFAKSLSLDVTNRTTLLKLTQASLECEDLKKSYTTLIAVRQQMGDDRSILMALGQTLKKMGRDEEAADLITAAMAPEAATTVGFKL